MPTADGGRGGSTGGRGAIAWLRSDLRVGDNAALWHACREPGPVAALVVLCPGEWRAHDTSAARVELVLRTLRELGRDLAALHIPLLIERVERAADVPAVVTRVAAAQGAGVVTWAREYGVNERRRDAEATRRLEGAGVTVRVFDGETIVPPGVVRTGDGRAFTVFTPFKKAVVRRLEAEGVPSLLGTPARRPAMACAPSPVPEAIEGFSSGVPGSLWAGGEREAERRLSRFIERALERYDGDRDRPDLDGTSMLSPYLACGAISARACLRAALDASGGKLEGGPPGAARWISELLWRDFFREVLVAHPRVSMGRAFQTATERIAWRESEADLERWCAGRTGYPLVDAAMRQLAATGWMHNRVRMVTAMFLSKDLLLDWRLGERHFMRHLVDGDLASNNGGWQWAASTGTDAAPYFRVLNPTTQARRFDPEGAYIRRWVPELRGVPTEVLHDPGGPGGRLDAGGYPAPMVAHDEARARALAAFGAARG